MLRYLLAVVISGAVFASNSTVTLVPSSPLHRPCEAHVVDGQGERVAPCGSPVEASGRAAGWIETDVSITPFLSDVSRGGEYKLPAGAPAGTVTFPHDQKFAAGERIRLVSLVAPRNEGSVQALFTRDVTSLNARPRMPAGGAIALLIDAQGHTIATSRIITIRPGTETAVWPQIGTTVLVAWLKRPRLIEHEEQDAVAVTTTDATDTHKPSAIVNSADAVFAVWYDLSGRSVRLNVDSAALRLERGTVDMARGSVTTVDAPLKLLPALIVAIAPLPAEVSGVPTPMTITVAEAAREGKALRTLLVEPGKTYTIEALPASLLDLDLLIDDFVLQKRADLTSGADMRVDIPLEPFVVSGTVFLGDTPVQATLQIQQKGKPVSANTDYRGEYAVTLWQPQRYVIDAVLYDHPAIPAFSQLVQINGSMTLDVHIPLNSLRARIYDASNGKPIERAEITIHNRWADESGQHSAVKSVPATSELSPLPPQRVGTSEIRVRAAGYSDAGPIVVTVDANLRERIIDIPMSPSSRTARVLIRLDGVSPAAGAEMAAWSGEELTWLGSADDAGSISVPDDVARSRVVIRHPSAASDVVVFGTLTDSETLSLGRAAEPLMVRVVRKDGSPVGPQPAGVSLWLKGGVRLSGAEAGFATWSFGATSPDGTVLLKGLWPKPLRLFATRAATPQQIRTGMFDGLAITVPYPWPAIVDVPLVDE